jgi:RNA polymerase sigma-70 factor, ECF subfamily
MQPATAAALFEKERGRLVALAYRMLGSRSDAEDIVQECYLRWHGNTEPVRSAEAWFTTVVTRLAIDHLRSAQVRREVYTGTWLPEPVVERKAWSSLETASELSIAFLYLLERLSPEERAAFVLREGFDYSYDVVAEILNKSEAACRKLVQRAKSRLHQERPRQNVNTGIIERYVDAVLAQDEQTLVALLSAEVREFSDGGGKVNAAVNPIEGASRVARLLLGLARKYDGRFSIERVVVNSEPGLIIWIDGAPVVASFETDGTRITAIYHILNPEKLSSIQTAAG